MHSVRCRKSAAIPRTARADGEAVEAVPQIQAEALEGRDGHVQEGTEAVAGITAVLTGSLAPASYPASNSTVYIIANST
jgi:hypothetical protein